MNINHTYSKNKACLEEISSKTRVTLNEMETSDYRNVFIDRLTTTVAKQIIAVSAEEGRLSNARIIQYENGKKISEDDCTLISFSVTDIKWLKKLNVCVMFGMQADDFMVISDTKTYRIEDDKIEETDISFKIRTSLGSEEMTYIADNECIRLCTILIMLQDDSDYLRSARELSTAVFHELSHLYDMFSESASQAELNREAVLGDASGFNVNSYLYNQFFGNPEQTLEEADADLIQAFMVNEGLYLCNKSELGARLCNFVREISDYRRVNFLRHEKNLERWLCSISPSYATIIRMKAYLEVIIRCTPLEIKRTYADKFIRNVWDKQKVFERTFSVDGKYDEKSFDAFFDYIIERLDVYFFKRCGQLIQWAEDSINEISNDYAVSMFPVILPGSQRFRENIKMINERTELIEQYKLKDIDNYRKRVEWVFL